MRRERTGMRVVHTSAGLSRDEGPRRVRGRLPESGAHERPTDGGADAASATIRRLENEIAALRAREAERVRQVALDDLLVNATSTFLRADEASIDSAMDEVLREFGEHAGVDRAALCELARDGATKRKTREWSRDFGAGTGDGPVSLQCADFATWHAALARGDLIDVSRVDELPDELRRERAILGARSVRSILIMPVLVAGDLLGVITFEGLTRVFEWRGYHRKLLRFLADNVGLTLRRVAQNRELREASERARRLAEEKDLASRAKSAFLANMTHEIRTPMNAILGFAQLVVRDPVVASSGVRAHVETILRSGGHLLNIIDDILDMSKIEAGRVTLRRARFSVAELVGHVVALFSDRAREKGLELVIEHAPDVPRWLVGDEGKVRQIVVNLVGNALKFTPSGRVVLRLTSAPAPVPGEVRLRIAVEDTGVGVASSDIGLIFGAFEQAQRGADAGGTGLGLAISRRFAELMGGSLTVESELGRGSTFALTADFPRAELAAEPGALARVPCLHALHPDSRPCRVAVVDDRADNRMLLRQMLVPLGFEVREASDGEDALALATEWQPHVMLLDLRMPRCDGYETLRRLGDGPDGRSTRVIVVTASAFREDAERALQSGADAYLRKPFHATDLLETLGRVAHLRWIGCDGETKEPAPSRAGASVPGHKAMLPIGLAHRLRAAVSDGDIMGIERSVAEVAALDERGARGLAALAADYAFERIEEWIDERSVSH